MESILSLSYVMIAHSSHIHGRWGHRGENCHPECSLDYSECDTRNRKPIWIATQEMQEMLLIGHTNEGVVSLGCRDSRGVAPFSIHFI